MRKKILALVLSLVMVLGCFGGFSASAADADLSFDDAYTMMVDMAEYLALQSPADRDYLYNWVHGFMKTDMGVESLITLVDDQSEAAGNNVVLNYIYSFGVDEASKGNLRFALELAKVIPTDARAKAFDDMKAREKFALETSNEQKTAIEAVYNAFLSEELQEMLKHEEHSLDKDVIMQFLADLNKTFVLTDDINEPAKFALYELNDEFAQRIETLNDKNGKTLKEKYETVNGVDWQTAEELIDTFVVSANGSSALADDEMKANFKTVLGIEGIDMYVPRDFDVTVSDEGLFEQVAGQTKTIEFTAVSSVTANEDLAKVEWYVNGQPVHTGVAYTYDPASLTAGQSATVTAKLGTSDKYVKEFTVNVVAAPSFTLGITSTGELSQNISAPSEVTFAAASDPEGTDLSGAAWYVNGKLQPQTGAEFKFTPEAAGEYVIYSSIDGAKSNEITVKVYGALSITSSGKLTQTTDSYSAVTFTAAVGDELTDLSGVKWYVNNTQQSATGKEFVYTPSSVGEYVVKAVLPDGRESTNTITIKVTATVAPSRPGGGGLNMGGTSKPEDKEPDYGDISQPIIAPTETDKINKFEDIEGHWAEPYMEKMYEMGVLEGTSATTLSPDWGITRQEVAVLLVRMLGLEKETPSGDIEYIDDADIADWARDAVYILSDRGIYVGYGDKSFQPERIISRQELVSVIGRQLTGEYEIELDYIDKDEIYFWAVEHVEELTAFGIVRGFEDKSFRPEEFVTRAQASVIFYNTMYRLGMIKITL